MARIADIVSGQIRNHGFLYESTGGWRLAPAYDVNPVPIDIKPRFLSTAIDLDDPTASLELALSVAEYFELDAEEARTIAREVAEGYRHEGLQRRRGSRRARVEPKRPLEHPTPTTTG